MTWEYVDGAEVVALYEGKIDRPFVEKPKMRTGYMKQSVSCVIVGSEGFDGDEQGFKGHGGKERAINHFPQEDYEVIQAEFPQCKSTLQAATLNGFGENLSTRGGNMNFHTVCIGDRFSVGSCILEVSQPRYPCKKVDLRHGSSSMQSFVLRNGLSGWFYRVIQTGKIQIGDVFHRISHPHPEWTLHKVQTGLYGDNLLKITTPEYYNEIINLAALSEKPWKIDARKYLHK